MTSIRDSLWEYRRRLAATIAQQRLNNRHFTIVSNDCWGAEVCRELGLQYQTPFVGLAIFVLCYIKFIKDLPRYMGEALKFTNISRYSSGVMSDYKLPSYSHPIKVLGDDIEIHFYHYENSTGAHEKWTRRCDRVVCLVGRLDPIKGHDVLIKALSILKQQDFKVIALVAGKSYGDELSCVMGQASEHDVTEQVHCLGMVETRTVLWASDLITLPSRREGFPLVILEGMLCGVIPIRTPAAGASDQIQDGIDGWIIPFESPEMLASRILETFENVDLKNRLSTQALQSAQDKFTIDRIIHQTIEAYSEVLVKESL